jgi:hypothetical protein
MRVFASKNQTTNPSKDAATKEDDAEQTVPEKKQATPVHLLQDHGLYYYTKVYLGSQLQELKVAFSTASTISLINS